MGRITHRRPSDYLRLVADSVLGPWEPLSLEETVEAVAALPGRWWITGGRALELFVGRSWRDHDDADVAVCRRDLPLLREHLVGWDLHVAASGVLRPWNGEALEVERHENNLWCRRTPEGPWVLDVTISQGDESAWIYRPDPALRVPWTEAVLEAAGVPYLAPELQLLFKSRAPRPKDDLDAQETIPELGIDARRRLATRLAPAHPWHDLLTAS